MISSCAAGNARLLEAASLRFGDDGEDDLVTEDADEPGAPALAGLTVLLAEDNLTNQMVATQMLESLGAETALANDGEEALALLRERRFDVGLIDIEMPRLSGLELIVRLRAGPEPIASMPLIALTAYVMREHRAAIEDAGADGIIAKPILSIEKFGSDILAHVRKRRSRGAAPPEPAASRAAETRRDFRPGLATKKRHSVGAEIDRAVFDRLWASFDEARQEKLAACLTEDIAAACEDLAAAICSRNFKGVRAATHILMAVAGSIGAVRLQGLAQRLNSAGHASNDCMLDDDGSDLLLEAERVLRFVHCGKEA